jgi:glycine/D-amino acid oxidase-like deaminating enzyme
VYAVDDQQAEDLEKIYQASKEAGVAVEYTNQIPVPFQPVKAIVYPRQAQVHPTRYVQALAKAFEQQGGVILENCPVDTFSQEDGVLVVSTGSGTIRARNLVWATHIPAGYQPAALPQCTLPQLCHCRYAEQRCLSRWAGLRHV